MNEEEIKVGLAPTASYRYAQQVGAQLFVAGQVPHDADGHLVGIGNPYIQATQCLRNLSTLVQLYGFARSDIRQLTLYGVGTHQDLTDLWKAVTDWFDNDVPPATLLGVALLGYEDQLVEIDATVVAEA